MLNQMILVGRLVSAPEKKENEGKVYANITLAVPRPFKNENGEYETDFIPVILFGSIAENTTEWCNKGDLVGVKGRIQTRYVEEEENKKIVVELIAEKVTFLSSKKEDENND